MVFKISTQSQGSSTHVIDGGNQPSLSYPTGKFLYLPDHLSIQQLPGPPERKCGGGNGVGWGVEPRTVAQPCPPTNTQSQKEGTASLTIRAGSTPACPKGILEPPSRALGGSHGDLGDLLA